MRRLMGLLLMSVCLGSWAFPAHATRVRRLTLTQTRDQAETVLLGTVNAATTRAGAGGKMVWTDYRVTIEELLLGAPGSSAAATTTISFAGGRHGALDVGILGVPQLEVGQRYVLFLLVRDHYPSATVGWGQGIYKVVEISMDAARRTVLLSYDRQPLELDADGALFRGSPIVVSDEGWQALSMRREDFDTSPKAPDPLVLDAAGKAIPQVLDSPHTSAVPVADRHFVDLSHLRQFLSGDLQESHAAGRQ